MEKFKKIAASSVIGFAFGWLVVGLYLFVFPPQGASFGGPSTLTYMAYGGFVGLFIGFVRGIWELNPPDSEQ